MRTKGIVLVLLLAGCSAVCAESGNSSAADHETQESRWRSIDADMSPREYRVAYRQNQRLVIDIMTYHSKRALVSRGIPEQAIAVVGSAMLLPVRDARFHLNKSKTMAAELTDVMDGERTLLLEFKKKW